MKQYNVIIVGASEEQRALLQMQVEATMAAQIVQTYSTYPVDVTDLTLRSIQEAAPEIILVDIPHEAPESAIRAIELLQNRLPEVTVFAIGDAGQSQVIIASIRAGAREFLERPTSSESLMEALGRLASAQRRSQGEQRGKIITIINSKGGCGATTIAVNTAMALQKLAGNVAIVDLVPQGLVALHLNARPSFTIADALLNLERLDGALLETYMVRCGQGLELLGGATEPYPDECSNDLPRLLDLLSSSYKYVVVDASSRLDNATRAVCNLSDTVLIVATTEVASMWSAAKTRQYLAANDDTKLKLVLNRFRKIPGLSETEIESVTQAKVLARIPNQYAEVDEGISRGIPVVLKGNSELARAFMSLGEAISGGTSSQAAEAKAPRGRTLGNLVGSLIQRSPEDSGATESSTSGSSAPERWLDAEMDNQAGAVPDRGNEHPPARPVPVRRESAPPAHSPQVVDIASDVSYDEEIQAEVPSSPSAAIAGAEAEERASAGRDVDTVVEAVMVANDSANSRPAFTLPSSDSAPVWKKYAIPAALVLIVAVILGTWMVRRTTAKSDNRSGASAAPVASGTPVAAQGAESQALLPPASGSTEAKTQAVSGSNDSAANARGANAQAGKSVDRRGPAMVLRSPGGAARQAEQPGVAPPVIAGSGATPFPLALPARGSNVLLRPSAQTASEPQPVKRVMPTYPPAAGRLGVAGKVMLQAQVRRDGTVGQVTALSGPLLLRPSAIAALKQWQYRPGTRNGEAVDSNITVEMNFTK